MSTVLGVVKSALRRHGPEILAGVGVAGMVASVVLAVRATPRAMSHMEERKEELGADELALKEVLKATWRDFAPTAAATIFSAACVVGSCSAGCRRAASLAAVATLTESRLSEYRGKVAELFGEEKAGEVDDGVAEDRMRRDRVQNAEVVIFSNAPDTLCYDMYSARYFRSSIDQMRRALNELNERMLRCGYVPLNDLYEAMGLEGTPVGEEMGWHICQGLLDLRFGSKIAADGSPCVVVDYSCAPIYDYDI